MGDAVSTGQVAEFATSTFTPGTMDRQLDMEHGINSAPDLTRSCHATSGLDAAQLASQIIRHPLQPVLNFGTSPKDMKGTMSAAAFENSLVTQFVHLLGSRQKQSLLLSDLGALMNGRLRTAIKEKGGLRTWVQRYPEHFVITGQPGKEHVSLIVPGTERDKENDPPEGKNLAGGERERSGGSYPSSEDNATANGAHPAMDHGSTHGDGKDTALHDSNRRERLRSAEKLGKKKTAESATEDADVESRQEQELEEEDAALFELHPILQLRGLPYHAHIEDILSFLGPYATFLKPPIRNSVQLVLNRDGRPSGFARVHFLTAESARECRDDLHMRRMDQRYVEIFLYNDRLSRRRKEEKLFGGHDGGDRDKNSGVEPNTSDEVLRECIAYLKQQGKDVLLSMLGVALSPQSREYLKQADQGLKQFLAQYPELSVEGTKGCECVCFATDSKLLGNTTQDEKSSSQQLNVANGALHDPRGSPVVGAPITLPSTQQHRTPATCNESTLPVDHAVDNTDSPDNSPPETTSVPFQPRLDELLTPPAAHVTTADYSHFMQRMLMPQQHGHALGFPQHHPGAMHYSPQASFACYAPVHAGLTPGGIPPHHHFSTAHHAHSHHHRAALQPQFAPMGAPHAMHDPLSRKPFTLTSPSTAESGDQGVDDTALDISSRERQHCGSPQYESTPSDWGTPMDSDGTAGDTGWTVRDPWGLTKKALASFTASDEIARMSVPSTVTMRTMDELSVEMGARCAATAGSPTVTSPSTVRGTEEGCSVRLRGLPYSSGEQDILSFFSRHNVVDRVASVDGAVKVETKPNGRPSGTAIVKLNNPEDMDAVKVALNDRWIEKRYIEVFTETEYRNANLAAGKPLPENAAQRSATVIPNGLASEFVGDPYALCMSDLGAQQHPYSNYSVEQPSASAHFSHMTATSQWNQHNIQYPYAHSGDASSQGYQNDDNSKHADAFVDGNTHVGRIRSTQDEALFQ